MHVPQRIRPQVPFIGSVQNKKVIVDAVSPIPTEHGTFLMYVFRWEGDEHEHVAMVRGDVAGREAVAVRVHSECMTSEVFHSLKCDCREQLHAALAEIARREEGVVLYLRQEGRGIGLANKIRAYALQAHGADTVDANRMLGLPDDARRYDMAALMLEHLGVKSVRLMTNNPSKVDELRRLGVDVVDRIPHVITPNQHSAGYLEAKRLRMHHALPSRPVAAVTPVTTSCSVPIETLDAE
ncbi:MAG: GTP cyclohydrolase II [Polyangiales bacterium]